MILDLAFTVDFDADRPIQEAEARAAAVAWADAERNVESMRVVDARLDHPHYRTFPHWIVTVDLTLRGGEQVGLWAAA